jgi:hypothetical protein
MNPILASLSLVLTGLSWHADKTDCDGHRFNAFNAGLGLRYQATETLSAQAGFYRNSQYRTGAYLLADWMPLRARTVAAGVFAGTANHYRLNGGRFIPVAGLSGRVNLGRTDLTARFVPSYCNKNSAFVSLEMAIKL